MLHVQRSSEQSCLPSLLAASTHHATTVKQDNEAWLQYDLNTYYISDKMVVLDNPGKVECSSGMTQLGTMYQWMSLKLDVLVTYQRNLWNAHCAFVGKNHLK